MTLTFPLYGTFAGVHHLGMDDPHHWVSLHFPSTLKGQEADAAPVVEGDGSRAGVVAGIDDLCEAAQRDGLGAEDLGVGAAGEQTLGEVGSATRVGQRLLQLRPLQVQLVAALRP